MRSWIRALAVGSLAVGSNSAFANNWVNGNVSLVDDYSGYDASYQVLITLTNRNFVITGDAAICTDRFRVVVGQEGMTAELQKRVFSMMVAAYLAGSRVRLFYNVVGAPYCTVQIASIGDLP
jgi:hypothetical protein